MKPARRWISLQILIAAIALCTHANRLIEILLVPHFICEHGSFAHEERPRGVQDRGAQTPQEQSENDHRLNAAPPSEGSHHHCDAWIFHHCENQIPSGLGEPTLVPLAEYILKAEHPASNPIELLILAPKASPPLLNRYN